MSDLMKEFLSLNSFWNIVFLSGFVLTVLSGTPIPLPGPGTDGPRRALQVPRHKQKSFFVCGLLLILVSLLMVGATHWAGLISPKRESAGGAEPEARTTRMPSLSFGLASPAFAQELGHEAARDVTRFELLQRHVHPLGGELQGLSVYLSDVHLIDTSRVIIFRNQSDPQTSQAGEYDSFRTRIPDSAILLDAKLSQNNQLRFKLDGKEYAIRAQYRWYPIGQDFAVMEISKASE